MFSSFQHVLAGFLRRTRNPSATRTVFWICILFYFVQKTVEKVPVVAFLMQGDSATVEELLQNRLPDPFYFFFALSGQGLSQGFFWTPFTYLFLHANLAHLLFNMFALQSFGNIIERYAGKGIFWLLFFVGGAVGGLCQILLGNGLDSFNYCIGASGAVLALVSAFAVLAPKAMLQLVLPFPVKISARMLALCLFAIDALSLAFISSHTAYLAHLGGLLTGAVLMSAARKVLLSILPLLFVFLFLLPLPSRAQTPERTPPETSVHTSLLNPGAKLSPEKENAAVYGEFLVLAQTLQILHENYVEELSYHDLTTRALRGLLDELDEHAMYMDAAATRDFLQNTNGEFEGLGFFWEITRDEQNAFHVTVFRPYLHGAAYRAGLRIGDEILSVNGVVIRDLPDEEAVWEAFNPETAPEQYEFVIARGDQPRRTIVLREEKMSFSSVPAAYKATEACAYLAIESFNDRTGTEFREALEKLGAEKLKYLILDLRGNPGGSVSVIPEIASLFLPPDTILFYELTHPKRKNTAANAIVVPAGKAPPYAHLKIAVLLNGESASAAEMLACILRDYERAKIFGTKSYGKGSMQQPFPLAGRPGEHIYFTIERWLTPRQQNIDGIGLLPDFEIPQTEDESGNARLRHIIKANPSLCSEIIPPALKPAPDAPFDAALAWLLAPAS